MKFVFPYPVEAIVFFVCACSYSLQTLQNEIVYQFVSEIHNYTSNHSVEYCSDNQSNSENYQIVADEASRWLKYISAAAYTASAVFAFLLTAWSDKIGRKSAILFPIVGTAISAAIQAVVVLYRLPLYVLVINGFIYGASGNYSALINIASAYLSDTTQPEDRVKRYTILEVCASFGGGMIMLATGYWVITEGFIAPSFFIVGCATMGILFIPSMSSNDQFKKNSFDHPSCTNGSSETEHLLFSDKHDVESSETQAGSKTAPESEFRAIWRIYTTEYSKCDLCITDDGTPLCYHGGGLHKGRLWRIWFYVISYSLYMFSVNGTEVFRTMFFVSYPVCFTPNLVGLQNGLDSALIIFGPLIIIFYESIVKFNSQTIILIAIFTRISAMSIIAFAKGPLLVFLSTSLGILFNFTTAVIRSQIVLLVSASEQGSALALLSGIESLINIFSPIAFLNIYPATLYIFNGFSWLVAAVMLCIPLTMMLVVWIAYKMRELHQIAMTD